MSLESQATKELAHEVKELRRVLTALNTNLIALVHNQRSPGEDTQLLVKKAFKRAGANVSFCTPCVHIECIPNQPPNNWVATGCQCCKSNHDLIGTL